MQCSLKKYCTWYGEVDHPCKCRLYCLLCALQELKSLVEEIARKHGIDVPDASLI